MNRQQLLRYFKEIKEGTFGDNSSNSEIIDYENGNSISINEIEDEYYKYLDLIQDINKYVEDNDLDDVIDKEEIKRHFNNIDNDLFEFNQACLLTDFAKYMIIKIQKENKNQRIANIIFNKTGNNSDTTKITLPVPWVKKLGFNEFDREAIIKLDGFRIVIEKKD